MLQEIAVKVNEAAIEETMDETIKLIRSLMILHGGLLIQEINSEYMQDVGEPVPFKKFGFTTLEEFLKSTGQFTAQRTAAGLKVSAKLTQKSAHIVKMRQEQNVSASERKRRKKKALGKTNASLARPNVKSSVTMAKPRPNTPKRTNPATNQRNRSAANNMNRVPQIASAGARPALVQISNNRPVNTSQQAQNATMSTKKAAPMKKVANNSTEKVDLHARLAPKQVSSESPATSRSPMAMSPEVVALTKRPVTLNRQTSHVTNIAPKTPSDSPSYTPLKTPPESLMQKITRTPTSDQPKRVNLRARLVMKQLQSKQKESTTSPTVPSNRSTLLRFFENIRQEQNKKESTSTRSVTFATTPSNTLQSRLVPKQPQLEPTTPTTLPQPILSPSNTPFMTTPPKDSQGNVTPTSNDQPKLSTRLVSFKPQPVVIDSDTSKTNEPKHDIHSRLKVKKQIDFNSELDEMSKQVN